MIVTCLLRLVMTPPVWVVSWTLPRQLGRDIREGLHAHA